MSTTTNAMSSMTIALCPADATDPDHAGQNYLSAIRQLQAGLIRVKILQPDVSPEDLVRSATFSFEFIAPSEFPLNPALGPKTAACPSAAEQASACLRVDIHFPDRRESPINLYLNTTRPSLIERGERRGKGRGRHFRWASYREGGADAGIPEGCA
jgi:hypothetical protein